MVCCNTLNALFVISKHPELFCCRIERTDPPAGQSIVGATGDINACIGPYSIFKWPVHILTKLAESPRISLFILTTDSRYVEQGCRQWLPKWQNNGWKSSNGKPVKNQDLWQQMAELLKLHTVELRWVRGHTGHPENERADTLATMGAAGKRIRRRSKPKAA